MTVPIWAVKGAKVVCIRDFSEASRYHDRGHRGMPVLNEVYEVTGCEPAPEHQTAAITLRGFPITQAFDVRGFRPLVSNERTEEQDVALFLPLLKTRVPQGEDA